MAELVVSELVSNVVRHSAGADLVAVVVGADSGTVRIEVTQDTSDLGGVGLDSDRGWPPADEMGGRGLRIIEELCTAWGIEGASTIWCELRC